MIPNKYFLKNSSSAKQQQISTISLNTFHKHIIIQNIHLFIPPKVSPLIPNYQKWSTGPIWRSLSRLNIEGLTYWSSEPLTRTAAKHVFYGKIQRNSGGRSIWVNCPKILVRAAESKFLLDSGIMDPYAADPVFWAISSVGHAVFGRK